MREIDVGRTILNVVDRDSYYTGLNRGIQALALRSIRGGKFDIDEIKSLIEKAKVLGITDALQYVQENVEWYKSYFASQDNKAG